MWHFTVCVCVCVWAVCAFFFLLLFCAFPAHHCVVWAKKPPVDQRQSSPSVQSHSNRKSEETEWKNKTKNKTIWAKNHHSHNITMLILMQFMTLLQCTHFCVYECKESLEEQTVVPPRAQNSEFNVSGNALCFYPVNWKQSDFPA